jgi:hypothetical protein
MYVYLFMYTYIYILGNGQFNECISMICEQGATYGRTEQDWPRYPTLQIWKQSLQPGDVCDAQVLKHAVYIILFICMYIYICTVSSKKKCTPLYFRKSFR